MGKIEIVVGGQFGSEGKGAIAAYLSTERGPFCAVRVAGPNAGHSVIDNNGRKWALRQVPVAAVVNPMASLFIAAGSEIDPQVLMSEVDALEEAGIEVMSRLYVDANATMIEPHHQSQEIGLVQRVGSTGKGIGAARADRVMRVAKTWEDWCDSGIMPAGWLPQDTTAILRSQLRQDVDVMIEGTQGYGLGLHAGWYPKCTSSNARAIDFLSMAGLSPWDPGVDRVDSWVVLRTFPIRVAGDSGPLYHETSWEHLNGMNSLIEPERTTVTQKVRRVGHWDPDLARMAVDANGGTNAKVAITFADYNYPGLFGAEDPECLEDEMHGWLAAIERDIGAIVWLVGTGPRTLIDLRGSRYGGVEL